MMTKFVYHREKMRRQGNRNLGPAAVTVPPAPFSS
jgi:hypothetical protein